MNLISSRNLIALLSTHNGVEYGAMIAPVCSSLLLTHLLNLFVNEIKFIIN